MPTQRKPKPFSERLRTARTHIPAALGLEKKFTLAEMGKVLGCHQNTVARLERGELQPSAQNDRCLVYALNLAILAKINPLTLRFDDSIESIGEINS